MSLPSRVAVVETKVGALEQEALRTRRRLHDLESDRATLRLLTRQVTELAQNVEAIATRAAEKAIVLALDARDTERRHGLSLRSQLLFGGISAFAVLVLLYDRFVG